MTTRTRRFLAALLVAAVYRLDKLGPVEVAKALWGVLRSLTSRGRRVDRWLYFKRLRWCFRCPIFFRSLRTCGSPLHETHPDLGCACNMERKAALPEATCWMNENTDMTGGWPPWMTPNHNPKSEADAEEPRTTT